MPEGRGPALHSRLRAALPARVRGAIPGRSRAALQRRLGIDARALAAFRIAVSAILLADLATRTRSLTAFYTDAGVLPREANAIIHPTLSTLSVHGLSGSAWVQWLLFVVAAILAVALLVGYLTRIAAVGSWLLLASLQFRNYLVLNGGDTVLLVALFVALFLPLGDRWSVDALADRRPSVERSDVEGDPVVYGFGSAALLTQIGLIYATNAVYKLRSEAWTSGTAIPDVYRVARYTVLLGDHVAEFAGVLEALNYGWMALLVVSPLLLVTTGWRRSALVGAFATAHVGMALTLDLGFFPHAMLACLLLFLPPGVWHAVDDALWPVTETVSNRMDDSRLVGRGGPLGPPWVRAGLARLVPVATATILVVGVLWQGVALGYVAAPDAAPVDPADHSWKLFAPHPPTQEGWFVVNGTLTTGAIVDLYPHADTLDSPPPDPGATSPTPRWRKYLAEVRTDATVRRYFADYLCRRGADRHGTPVETLSITYVRQPARPDGAADRTRVDLGQYRCPVVD